MRDGGKGAGEDRGDGKGSDDDLKCSCPVQLKTAYTHAVSTTRWHRRRWWEYKPVQGLLQRRTAMGPHNTVRGSRRRRGGTKNPGGRARSGNWPTERRRRGAPPNSRTRLTRAADKGGEGEGEPSPSSQTQLSLSRTILICHFGPQLKMQP